MVGGFCGGMEYLERSGKELLEGKELLVILRRLDLSFSY